MKIRVLSQTKTLLHGVIILAEPIIPSSLFSLYQIKMWPSNLPVFVARQISDILFRRRVTVAVLKADTSRGRVGHLRRGHRELHVAVFREIFGNLVVGSESHTAYQLMRGVRAWK